jgi:hypothetical protein
MTDARNVYPRLCWGCLCVIADYEHDRANLNYGGWCESCVQDGRPEMAGLREALRGHSEYMNNVYKRVALLGVIGEKGINPVKKRYKVVLNIEITDPEKPFPADRIHGIVEWIVIGIWMRDVMVTLDKIIEKGVISVEDTRDG